MNTARQPRVGLFIDASNINISLRQTFGNDARLNYERLLATAHEEGDVRTAATYYSLNGTGDQRFLVRLKHLGYEVRYRTVRASPNGNSKANADMEMAFSIAEAVYGRRLRKVLLVTGDFDFLPVVQRLVDRGVDVEVLGPEGCTAWELIVAASRFTYLGSTGLVDGMAKPGVAPVLAPPLGTPLLSNTPPPLPPNGQDSRIPNATAA